MINQMKKNSILTYSTMPRMDGSCARMAVTDIAFCSVGFPPPDTNDVLGSEFLHEVRSYNEAKLNLRKKKKRSLYKSTDRFFFHIAIWSCMTVNVGQEQSRNIISFDFRKEL